MHDDNIGWTRRGRDSDECLEATRDALSLRSLLIGLPIAVALWTVIAMVIAGVFA